MHIGKKEYAMETRLMLKEAREILRIATYDKRIISTKEKPMLAMYTYLEKVIHDIDIMIAFTTLGAIEEKSKDKND
jgi:hypothetical protein|tara:strand:+ start:27 stop:254 length:228 start_codon:yes stop_codon:yes gene_type:complete